MKWNREEYIRLMTFGDVDRPMFVELFGLLIGLDSEWKAQGAAPEQLDLSGFDFDYVPIVASGANTQVHNGFVPRVIEENDQYLIRTDEFGRTIKLPKGFATIGLPMDYPVKDMDSWLKIKHLFTFTPERINWDAVAHAKKMQGEGHLVNHSIFGGFDLPRELMGEEELCVAYYEQPELIQDILDTITHTSVECLTRIGEQVTIDNLMIHEDMAGKSGSLIGPNLIRQYLKPYYRSVIDLVKNQGTKIYSVDTDGNIDSIIDALLECGVNVLYPMEPAAGMDSVKVRAKYGDQLAIKGGFDKLCLRKTKEDIRKEVEYKLQPSMLKGMAFGCDHRIPNGVPLDNYVYYVKLVREMLGMPPLGEGRGWQRMAF